MPPVTEQHRNEVRIEESCQEVDRLRDELTGWLADRTRLDAFGQYRTQLASLQTVLLDVIGRIRADLAALRLTDPTSSVYRRCRDDDERTVFARRFWTFFREKFDQRDVPALIRVVAAADEVVWSCYSEGFRATGTEPLSAPLPYVEPEFSPRALGRSFPPRELAAEAADPVLGNALRLLPLPLIGIPSICVARPWWLIFLAHESGHQLHADLASGSLRTSFADRLGEAVANVGGVTAETESAWRGWSREVFADAVSVLAVGASAEQAISELEAGADRGPLRGTAAYPPSIVRRALMRGLLDAQAAAGEASGDAPERAARAGAAAATEALAAVEAAARTVVDGQPVERARAYLAAIPDIVRMVTCERFDGTATLPALCGWQACHVTGIETWRQDFGGGAEPFPETTRQGARLAIAGGYQAWLDIARLPRDERTAAVTTLRDRILSTVPDCREPAPRAAPAPGRTDLESIAASISDRMFHDVKANDW